MNDLTVKKATDAWVAAHEWIRRAPRRDGTVTTFTGPTADEIIAAAAGSDHGLYRAYEAVVVERARKRLKLGRPSRSPRPAWRAPLTDGEVARIIAMRKDGAKYREIARATRRSNETVGRVLADAGLAGRMRA